MGMNKKGNNMYNKKNNSEFYKLNSILKITN